MLQLICFYDRWEHADPVPLGATKHPFEPNTILKSMPVLAGVKNKDMIALLVKAIQEQKTRIDSLSSRVSALESA